jgi:hypothetical protein
MDDQTDEQETTETQTETTAPDFSNATAVAAWFGQEIIRLIRSAKREKSLTRLRALSSAVDSWAKLHRLATDTDDLQTLKIQLAELREEVESQRRHGPTGVVQS